MTRRYRREALEVFERSNVAVRDFPVGGGPPLYVNARLAEWRALGFGERVLVRFDGKGGAYAHGMVRSRVIVWARFTPEGVAGAYCLHAPPGPLPPSVHDEALARLNYRPGRDEQLYVVIASRSDVTEAEERFFTSRGVPERNLFTYSNSFLPQFGVSGNGFVGEVR